MKLEITTLRPHRRRLGYRKIKFTKTWNFVFSFWVFEVRVIKWDEFYYWRQHEKILWNDFLDDVT